MRTRLALSPLEDRSTPTTFTVTTTADAGAGSLRQAMQDAYDAAGPDAIHFNIPGGGVHTIVVGSALPTVGSDLTVNGYTQPGSSSNTLPVGNNAVIRIEIDGNGTGNGFVSHSGTTLSATTIRGLSLVNFANAAIHFHSASTVSNSVIEGNFIGVRPDGVTKRANGTGILFDNPAGTGGHRIGGTVPAQRNVISGNTYDGIYLHTKSSVVQGNYIGTNAAGTEAVANGSDGIELRQSENLVGGELDGPRNVLSGNGGHGIYFAPGTGANNAVESNHIGVSADGMAAVGNGGYGVYVASATGANRVGTGNTYGTNVISGNGLGGAYIELGVPGLEFLGNRVGTDASGTAAVPNNGIGVYRRGSSRLASNLVSGNALDGFHVGSNNTLTGNRVGVSQSGNHVPLPNGRYGIHVTGTNTLIGGTGYVQGNLVKHNADSGVRVTYPGGSVRILSNMIDGNGGLGIDLVGGGNNDQPAPAITRVERVTDGLRVTGTLTAPAGVHRVEVFAVAAPDPTGVGEGDQFLGFVSVTVGGSGTATFTAEVAAPSLGLVGATPFVSATATFAGSNSTSEFSRAVSVGGVTPGNTAPTITAIANQTITVGGASGPIAFQVQDAESPADALVVTAASTNGDVVPVSGVVIGGTGAARTVNVTLPTARSKASTSTVTLTVRDPSGATAETSFQVFVRDIPDTGSETRPGDIPLLVGKRRYVLGADRGGSSEVQLRDQDGTVVISKRAFGDSFTGGVRSAAGDINGDGVADIIAASGPGGPPTVVVFDGKTGAELQRFDAFESSFTGGLFVTSADFDGDGCDDLVISPDQGGGPRVQIRSGKTGGTIADFFGIDDVNFRGGARPAVGDITGDGRPDLVVAAGFSGGPRVGVFDGAKLVAEGGRPDQGPALWNSWKPFGDLLIFDKSLRNGAYVTVGDIDGDGHADLIGGGGPGGAPHVKAFSGAELLAGRETLLANFFAGDVNNRGGVRLAVKNLDEDRQADLVTAPGEGGGSRVRRYVGKGIVGTADPAPQAEDDAFPGFSGGVFVG